MEGVCYGHSTANQQAIHVRLYSFEGNEKAVQLLKVADLQAIDGDANNGWKNLYSKLDLVFKEEENDELYMHYARLNNLKQIDKGLSMMDFIVEFEHLYDKVAEGIQNIPDPLVAFILLDGAQLTDSEKKMAFTFCKDITFANMKSALKRLKLCCIC